MKNKSKRRKVIFCVICGEGVEKEIAKSKNEIETKDVCVRCFDEL